MWKWPTRICVCRQIVKALQNYFCQIESYFFHMVLSQAQRFWNHTDVWFFWFLLNKTKHICLESWISCLHYEDNSDENFNTRHSVPLSFIATKYSSISHGQLTVVSVNNFTFQGKVLMKISPPGFIAFIASKYSNVPIPRGQLVDPVVLVNNTSAIWTFQI